MRESIQIAAQEEIDALRGNLNIKRLPVPSQLLDLVMLIGTPGNIIRFVRPDGASVTWIEEGCADRLHLLAEELQKAEPKGTYLSQTESGILELKIKR